MALGCKQLLTKERREGMKIVYMREPEHGRVRMGIGEGEDVSRYSVSLATVSELGLMRGMELGDEAFSVIASDDERYRCMKRALSLLSYGDNTKGALLMKLLRSGFPKDVAAECIRECLRLGYIDERRQIERAVINEANRSFRGRSYIMKKLRSKGYSASDISEVIDMLIDSGEIDFGKSFERLCEKKGVSGDEERTALLYKYGYRTADID